MTSDPVSAPTIRAKVFCVGFGKTGTTSLEAFFNSLGFMVGDQAAGELLLGDWAVRNFEPIIALARTAEFFQDFPFSAPYTFQALDMAFPNSRFILTMRDDSEQWFQSLIRFHTQLIGKGRIPTADDLREFPYRYKGWILEAVQLLFRTRTEDIYNKDALIGAYEHHNASVKSYFAFRLDSLLAVNLTDPSTARAICEFAGVTYDGQPLPHLNRTS